MEGMFKGIAWLSVIALATGGALTFVPDQTWESCPPAFSPVRARLADVGIAPVKYRRSAAPQETAELVSQNPYERALENPIPARRDIPAVDDMRTRVQIGDRRENAVPSPAPVNSRFTGHATSDPTLPDGDDYPPIDPRPADDYAPLAPVDPVAPADDIFSDDAFNAAPAVPGAPVVPDAVADVADPMSGTATYDAPGVPPAPIADFSDPAGPAVADMPGAASGADDFINATPNDAIPSPAFPQVPAAMTSEAPADMNALAAPADPAAAGVTSFPQIPTTPDGAIPPMTPPARVETPDPSVPAQPIPGYPTVPADAAAVPAVPAVPAVSAVPGVPGAPTVADVPAVPAAESAPTTIPAPAAEQSQTLAQQPGVANSVPTAPQQPTALASQDCAGVSCSSLLASGNAAGALDVAMRSAQNIESSEQARDVFVTLNQLRRVYLQQGRSDVVAQINSALDRLAFEVFYNPQRAILEPMRQTLPGETLTSIARECEVTPETLAAINGLQASVDAPLPPGTNLKVVHGPVTAEVSASRKELLLNFNNLYAGRFRCGLPQQASGLRGEYVVERKLENPECKAVDMTGAEVMIPGGAAENPLGSCWIGLNGGYGLQGTNRPELVGADVPENGGFVFSNREISQLNLLLPIGSSVYFTD